MFHVRKLPPLESLQENVVSLSKTGYLQFRDIESFKATLESLKNKNPQELAEWKNQIGIQSLRSKFTKLSETDSHELNPVEEPYFAAVIDSNGIFTIGGEIHVITYEKEYLIPVGNENEIQTILSGKNQLSSKVKSFAIQRKVFGLKDRKNALNIGFSTKQTMSISNNKNFMWTGDKEVVEPECGPNNRRERVKLMAFVNNYASYGIVGVKILGQLYRKGRLWGSKAWRSDATLYGKIEGTANFTYAGGLFNESFSVEQWQNDDIRKTIYDYYTTPFYSTINANYIDATYTYQKGPSYPLTTKHIRHQ